jgi:hypothetical protein
VALEKQFLPCRGDAMNEASMLDVRARIQPVRVEEPMTGDEGQLT